MPVNRIENPGEGQTAFSPLTMCWCCTSTTQSTDARTRTRLLEATAEFLSAHADNLRELAKEQGDSDPSQSRS